MLMLIYTILAMAVTPIVYELVNRRVSANERIGHLLTGWPSYAVNVIVCAVVALVAMFLPAGWEVSLWNWIILTALIYFGNQFVYNSFVKIWMRAKTRV